jgi:fumarylacetoacetase
MNSTHDPLTKSWLASANRNDSDFPIQNLPFAILRRKTEAGTNAEAFRGAVAIGDQALDLARLAVVGDSAGILGLAADALKAASQEKLNVFMGMGPKAWSALRLALFDALKAGSPVQSVVEACFIPLSEVEYALPAQINDYTDFYASIHHARSVGKMFRPDSPLTPNYQWVPIGYHGRSSSLRLDGYSFRRPSGQVLPAGASTPVFSECKRLDYEFELGVFLGQGNSLGEPIAIDQAPQQVFGMVILNDWSARDIQAWEYQPLGPFLAKNFCTSISPWIITNEALEPYRLPWSRPSEDPQPLAYLDSAQNREQGALDIHLETWLQTPTMAAAGSIGQKIATSNFKHCYWSVAQLIAHHTVGGCNFQAGDLIGTGTQSGPTQEEAGSLLELSMGGKQAISLGNGETRSFLQDGDTLTLTAFCQKPGVARIGFGRCAGTVLPALNRAP